MENLRSWIEKGVFEAMEKKFLERLEFVIYEIQNGEREILETYSFNLTYPDETSYQFLSFQI